jgi:hypothetical protein
MTDRPDAGPDPVSDDQPHSQHDQHHPDQHDGAHHGSRPADRDAEAQVARSSTFLADAIGGPRGMLDTGIPAVVFVIVNAISSLHPAIYAAIGFAVVLLAIRLVRREPVQQALAGFIGVGIAALVAARTGTAKGFFLPGIISQALLTVAAFTSLVIRRPYIGYVMAGLDPRYAKWRETPALLRAMDLATIVWGSVFLLRTLVQGLLYLADRPGWLAVVQLIMGWPLFALALATSYWLARRAAPAGEDAAEETTPAAT